MGEHLQPAPGSRRPLFTGTIPAELDAILVGIAQVERLTHAVVGCAVELDARSQEASQRIGQLSPRGIKNGEMKKASAPTRRR